MKPFIKWYGGKRRVLPKITGLLPEKITTYVEPFVGGGAVACWVMERHAPATVVLNDACAPLIAAWQAVASNPAALIEETQNLLTGYALAQDKAEYYNRIREQYNNYRLLGERYPHGNGEYNVGSISAAFLFFNRTGFNGLYRVNSNTKAYNTPHVSHERTPRIDAENIMVLNKVLCRSIIHYGDFEYTLSWAKLGAVFYFDPPYRGTAAGVYTAEEFDDAEHRRLAAFVRKCSRLGARCIVSVGDAGDGFFEELYDGFSFLRFNAMQTAAHRVDSRRPRPEMLIHNTLS